MFSTKTSQNTTAISDTEETNQPSPSEQCLKAKCLWVWEYFKHLQDGLVQCQYLDRSGNQCNKRLKKDGTGSTKGITDHLTGLHLIKNPNKISSEPQESIDKFLRSQPRIKCELPISITELSAFQFLLELCNPSEFNPMVCQAALTAHLSHMFLFHQEHICKLLLVNGQFISFTTDIWTSTNVTAFISVTAHFMDEDYKLTWLLLVLCKIIAKAFVNIISQYNLNQHIVCITTNNALVNNCINQEIQSLCPTYTANTQAIGCMAHTIHLAAHDGLNALGNAASDALESSISSDPMAITNLVSPPDGLNLKYNSVITCIGQLASYLHQSPQRREKFITTVKLVYDNSRPTHATMILSHVPTLSSYQLTFLEWDKVRVMVDFLHPLYEETQIICGEDYPTINNALPLYIMLLKRISEASNQYDISQMEEAISAIHQKLSKYLQLLLQKTPVICASILDPCFKIKFFIVNEATLAHFGTTANQCLLCFKEQAKKHFNYPPDNSSKQISMNKH
ncbi:hypothetical protein O181_019241 [Austropuccinia psidii MF-1]|uniref:BED-type domain-containing protein n=1 Tax=Austropuccinia psidii MF-1 TaxID=1389203 RepID=A0A9Q3CB54_9BASI|nr:hypothetical protein [Austropuccinia psidii MF-1]